MDLMLAPAAAVGPSGKAIGVPHDRSQWQSAPVPRHVQWASPMLTSGRRWPDLPVDSASADFVITNGVLNLMPDKRQDSGRCCDIFKSAGQFLYADIVVANELSESLRRDIDLWTG